MAGVEVCEGIVVGEEIGVEAEGGIVDSEICGDGVDVVLAFSSGELKNISSKNVTQIIITAIRAIIIKNADESLFCIDLPDLCAIFAPQLGQTAEFGFKRA